MKISGNSFRLRLDVPLHLSLSFSLVYEEEGSRSSSAKWVGNGSGTRDVDGPWGVVKLSRVTKSPDTKFQKDTFERHRIKEIHIILTIPTNSCTEGLSGNYSRFYIK